MPTATKSLRTHYIRGHEPFDYNQNMERKVSTSRRGQYGAKGLGELARWKFQVVVCEKNRSAEYVVAGIVM